MNISETWNKALKFTTVVRSRLCPLETFRTTELGYILLSESPNPHETSTRKGQVSVARPSLILPSHSPQFQGFEWGGEDEPDWDLVTGFLLVRGITFPSLKYSHRTEGLSRFEGDIRKAAAHYSDELERKEDVTTSLVVGPEDCWPFSLLIFIASHVARSAHGDVKKIFDEYRQQGRWF